MIFRVTSQAGPVIIYDEAAKAHVETRHQEMSGRTDVIRAVVSEPLLVYQDKEFDSRYNYFDVSVHPAYPQFWVKVVVDMESNPAMIVTAHVQRSLSGIREGGLIYVRSTGRR